MTKTIFFIFSVLLATQAYAVDGNELLRQIDRNLAPESYELYRKLINIEPDGKKKEFRSHSRPFLNRNRTLSLKTKDV